MPAYALLAEVTDRPGILSGLTKVLADYGANITYVDIHTGMPTMGIYFEVTLPEGTAIAAVLEDLHKVTGVQSAAETPSFSRIYGKRIIVMGGGAQVGQVALGAITEADRHNIRGEHISVDTIPLVGEQALAAAVRAVVRLPRVRLLVLAGALMGGDIAAAVEEVRANGLFVISLNMAGTVPDAADLVTVILVKERVALRLRVWRPRVHRKRQGDRRILIAMRKAARRIRPHQRVDQPDRADRFSECTSCQTDEDAAG